MAQIDTRRLRDLAEQLANKLTDSPRGKRDVSNEPRVPKGQPGGGEWTSDGSSQKKGRSGHLANSHTPAPFTDDRGKPVLDKDGKPMQRPSDVDMRFFVDQGRAAVEADRTSENPGTTAFAGLTNFRRGGPWDIQRVGPDGSYVGAFRDAANVAIGMYGAAVGLPQSIVMGVANQEGRTSNFGPNPDMDSTYTHLPKADVYDVQKGYSLVQSGEIGPSPGN